MLFCFFSCKHWTLSQTLWHTSRTVSKHLRVVTVRATPCLFFLLQTLLIFLFCFVCLIYSLFILCIFAQCYCIDLWYVQSFLLPHWWCAFSRVIGACAREGGVKTKPCASRDLTRLALFYNAKKQIIIIITTKKAATQTTDNQKCTKCALWRTDLPRYHQTLGI